MGKLPFEDRIAEAKDLYAISKGTPHEDTCWNYLEAVVKIARIARGQDMRDTRVFAR